MTILILPLVPCIAAVLVLLLLRTRRRQRCTLCVTAQLHRGDGLFPDTHWAYTYEGKTYRAPICRNGFADDAVEVYIDPDAPEVCYYFGDMAFWAVLLPLTAVIVGLLYCL